MSAIPTEKLVPGTNRPTIEIDDADDLPPTATPFAEPFATPFADPFAAAPRPDTPTAGPVGGADMATSRPPASDPWPPTREPRPLLSPLLAGIEVTLSVEIGNHRLPLAELMAIDPGQIFALDRLTSEPVSVLVNGKPFARGEIVALGDRFGVRLLELEAQAAL